MPSHNNVNRPVRSSKGVLHRQVVDVELDVTEDLVEGEALVEEVSIDGMCGVY